MCRCVPYRYTSPRGATSMADEEDIQVLLITAQRKGKGMLFPKVINNRQLYILISFLLSRNSCLFYCRI